MLIQLCCSSVIAVSNILATDVLCSLSLQGVKGVPVPHGPKDALHDQLEGPAAASGDSAGGAVVHAKPGLHGRMGHAHLQRQGRVSTNKPLKLNHVRSLEM